MSLNDDELINDESRKFKRLESVPDAFVNSVKGLQGEVIKDIEDLVSQLETQNGIFVFNERNLNIISSIDKKLKDTVFNDEYINAVKKFAGEFNTQAGINNAYFATIEPGFTPNKLYESVLRSTQKSAIDLLGEDAFTQKLINPLKQILESSITNGQSFADTMTSLRYAVVGDDTIDGAMVGYVKRVAYDGFAVSDRAYTNVIAQDSELEFYKWAGGLVKGSRCFCIERHGKFYHRKEIEEWGEGKNVGKCGYPWQGMNSATNKATIFYFCGGYHCFHGALPVSIKSVPKAVIERNIASGNYKPKAAA